MITTTADTFSGRTIVEEFGVVTGNTVRSKHVGRDIMAGFKTLVGGEVKGYTEMLTEARQEALERLKENATAMGANGIINVRFTTSAVAAGMSEMLAYGTAVRVE